MGVRPHTAALIALLLKIILEKSTQNGFTVNLHVKRGEKILLDKYYDLYVNKREDNYLKITTGRMWTCEAEIFRSEPNKNSFYIKHNHGYAEEHFEVYSNSLNGKYKSHSTFDTFETKNLTLSNLKFEASYKDLVYEIKRIT